MFGRRRFRTPRHSSRTWGGVARRMGPPLFVLKDAGPARQGGSGWGSGRYYQAGVRQHGERGDVEVETSSHGRLLQNDSFMLTAWLHHVVHPAADLAFPLELRADRWVAPVVFSGVPHAFVFIGNETAWIGQGEVAGRAVEISGMGRTEGLELETVKWRKVKED